MVRTVFLFIFGLCLIVQNAHAAALVTFSQGSVKIKAGTAAKNAPRTPFKVSDGKQIVLGKNAKITLLGSSGPKTHKGPKTISIGKNTSKNPKLAAILNKKIPSKRVGASRATGGFMLLRPVVGLPVLSLRDIRWECDDCGDKSVELLDTSFSPIWDGSGTGSIKYTGSALTAGNYTLSIDGKYYAFTIAPTSKVKEVKDTLNMLNKNTKLNSFEQVSIHAALLYQAELQAEALYILDTALSKQPKDQNLKQLIRSYEDKMSLHGN